MWVYKDARGEIKPVLSDTSDTHNKAYFKNVHAFEVNTYFFKEKFKNEMP